MEKIILGIWIFIGVVNIMKMLLFKDAADWLSYWLAYAMLILSLIQLLGNRK